MINIDRLDDGYDTTHRMFNLEKNEGVQLVKDLDSLIANLKEHWIGEDGTERINQLIEVHDQLQEFLKSSFASTTLAMKQIVELQEVRRSNGSSAPVGDVQKEDDSFVKAIPKLGPTEKYYIDPAVRADYKTLMDIGGRLKTFANNIQGTKTELMDNWHEGNHREEVNQVFDEMGALQQKFETVFNGVAEKLDKAVGNAEKVME